MSVNCIEVPFPYARYLAAIESEIGRKSRPTSPLCRSCKGNDGSVDRHDPVFSQSTQVIRRDSHSYKGIKRQASVERRAEAHRCAASVKDFHGAQRERKREFETITFVLLFLTSAHRADEIYLTCRNFSQTQRLVTVRVSIKRKKKLGRGEEEGGKKRGEEKRKRK